MNYGEWISVDEKMPAPGKVVLAGFTNVLGNWRTARAHHAPLHTVDASTWEDGSDDTDEGSFEPEGWWEDPAVGETMEFIDDDVTHWMPLPAGPIPSLNEVEA